MKIAIDASSGFIKKRTGVEEYTHQILKEFRGIGQTHQFILYINNNAPVNVIKEQEEWPNNFQFKVIPSRRMVINPLLSFELWRHKPDVLWIPGQVMPVLYYPKNTVVSIHGLEYEHFPAGYSKQEQILLRFSTKFATKHASQLITVSEHTKNDLIKFYNANSAKISVVHNGFTRPKTRLNQLINTAPYFLYIGRLEPRKNIINLVKAFDLFKLKHQTTHQLYLVGKPCLDYRHLKELLYTLKHKDSIQELGFVTETKKHQLLSGATAFIFPSFAEGFGIPVLEAMSVGTPVLSSDRTSLPEVGGQAALYFDPSNPAELANKMWQLVKDKSLSDKLSRRGFQQIQKFSWRKCAKQTLAKIVSGH